MPNRQPSSQPKRESQTTSVVLATCLFVVCSAYLATLASAQGFQNINVDFLRRNVVFIEVPCNQISPPPAGCIGNTLTPWGTGLLVTVPHKGGGDYVILATARHMVDPSWTTCSKEGPTEIHAFYNKAEFAPGQNDAAGTIDKILSRSPDAWRFPDDDSADVAVLLFDGHNLEMSGVENLGVSIRDLPTDNETSQVRTGDQIISAGLLVGASGAKRNYPIFKFGYVSSIPGEKIGMQCCPTCSATKYLSHWMIAASLVPGNSGSPIYFVPSLFQINGIKTNQRVLYWASSLRLFSDQMSPE